MRLRKVVSVVVAVAAGLVAAPAPRAEAAVAVDGNAAYAIGDVDGDGTADIAIPSSGATQGCAAEYLALEVRSGADGSLIVRHEERAGMARPIAVQVAADGSSGGVIVESETCLAGVSTIRLTSWTSDGRQTWQRAVNSSALPYDQVPLAQVGNLVAGRPTDVVLLTATWFFSRFQTRALVIDGRNGSIVAATPPMPFENHFLVTDDLSGDGLSDVVIGTWVYPYWAIGTGVPIPTPPQGVPPTLTAFRGSTGEPLWAVADEELHDFFGELLDVGDATGDGRPDLLVTWMTVGSLERGSSRVVVDGATGRALFRSRNLSAVGDADGDGLTDFLEASSVTVNGQQYPVAIVRRGDTSVVYSVQGDAVGSSVVPTFDRDGDDVREFVMAGADTTSYYRSGRTGSPIPGSVPGADTSPGRYDTAPGHDVLHRVYVSEATRRIDVVNGLTRAVAWSVDVAVGQSVAPLIGRTRDHLLFGGSEVIVRDGATGNIVWRHTP